MSEKKQRIQKEKTEKKPNKFYFVLLCAVIVAFSAYVSVTLISLHMQIAGKKAELEAINTEISVQQIKNTEMKKLHDYSDEEFSDYVEQIARDDLDYVAPGERVFVNVSGD